MCLVVDIIFTYKTYFISQYLLGIETVNLLTNRLFFIQYFENTIYYSESNTILSVYVYTV